MKTQRAADNTTKIKPRIQVRIRMKHKFFVVRK